jgi:hypothetical protein
MVKSLSIKKIDRIGISPLLVEAAGVSALSNLIGGFMDGRFKVPSCGHLG